MAYAAIPNGGDYVQPYFVDRIEDRRGDVIFEHETETKPVISDLNACYATQILEDNVQSGTGTRARLDQQAAAGKTGTTEENYDAWFVGFTPYLTTAVWMGNPNAQVSMANLNGVANFGGTYPALIWKAFNEPVHQGLPVVGFPECQKPSRSAQIVIGQGNPFLNGWRFGYSPRGSSQRRSGGGGGGGGGTTSTTAPSGEEPPITVAPPTVAPPTSAPTPPGPAFGGNP